MRVQAALLGAVLSPLPTVHADCLVGDVVVKEGEPLGGHIGLECIDDNSYDGSATACGPNGEVAEMEMVFTCPESVPYCVQCGPRGWGAALCLSTPDVGNRDCGDPASAPPNNGETETTPGIQGDSELYLPDATIGAFDQCDNAEDIRRWASNGGMASLPEHTNFCSLGYYDGCMLDAACIQGCFQDAYGYSAECAACFGKVPTCSASNGCTEACAADSMGTECRDCNAPCIAELNECTGLPQIDSTPIFGCMDGREGVDDPTCTLTLREQTCEGRGFREEECGALSCCQWDAVAELCNAACVIPDDGEACCVLVESDSDTSNPTKGPTSTVPPTASPTSKPTAPAPSPDNSRDGSSGSAASRPAGFVAHVVGLLLALA